MAMQELDVEIGSGAIEGAKGQAQPAKPQAAAKQSEEDELKALEMMMA